MGLAERLQGRLDEVGISQGELARRVGVATQTIWKLAAGQSRSSVHLHKIARVLGTTPEYLTGETDNPDAPDGIGTNASDQDQVQIDSLDLAYGMGGTFVDIGEIEVEKATFSREWLRKFTQSAPDHLFTTSGVGDSMTPTIHDSDIVIVDRSEQLDSAMGEKIWAVVFGGVGMIKRLRPMPDGTVKIMSDNLQVRDELATDNDLYVIGRVVAKVSRL